MTANLLPRNAAINTNGRPAQTPAELVVHVDGLFYMQLRKWLVTAFACVVSHRTERQGVLCALFNLMQLYACGIRS